MRSIVPTRSSSESGCKRRVEKRRQRRRAVARGAQTSPSAVVVTVDVLLRRRVEGVALGGREEMAPRVGGSLSSGSAALRVCSRRMRSSSAAARRWPLVSEPPGSSRCSRALSCTYKHCAVCRGSLQSLQSARRIGCSFACVYSLRNKTFKCPPMLWSRCGLYEHVAIADICLLIKQIIEDAINSFCSFAAVFCFVFVFSINVLTAKVKIK